MIAKIEGVVFDISAKSLIVDTGYGVSYEIFMTNKNLSNINKDDRVKILTEQIVKEDSNTLYGFLDSDSKKTFTILQKVSGVGPKMALQILELFSFNELEKAINIADPSVFRQVSGVGNKLAQKIILELKGNVDLSSNSDAPLNNAKKDAISGLINLGYKKSHIIDYITQIDSENTSEIIKKVLKKIGQK